MNDKVYVKRCYGNEKLPLIGGYECRGFYERYQRAI